MRGLEDDGVHVFRGIPFARPPVGPLRFAAPEPPEPWTGEREATAFGAAPPQPVDGLSVMLGLLPANLETSEDCLTLNVHVPAEAARDGRRRPVMVWLHGGAFQTGAASGPVYDGRSLARRGDVVLVTLNYRVGALGFLHMGGEAPPNRGLLDQVAALEFIQREIEHFGGDPGRVTVFGESAGAGSLCALLAMPRTAGLFHAAILQSAAPEGLLNLEEGSERASILLEKLKLMDSSLTEIRDFSTSQILAAQKECNEPGPRRIGMFFAPIVDGDILPAPPLDAIAAGSTADRPLIVMTTREEMQLYHLVPGFPALDDAQLRGYIASRLEHSAMEPDPRVDAIFHSYEGLHEDLLDRFFAVETDASLWIPATRMAEAQAQHQERTWMARFSWPSPMRDGRLGACHALDIAFALGNHRVEGIRDFTGDGPGADDVAEQVTGAWARFAHDFDPNGGNLPSWPPYSAPDRCTLEFDRAPRCLKAPLESRRRAWRGEQPEAQGSQDKKDTTL